MHGAAPVRMTIVGTQANLQLQAFTPAVRRAQQVEQRAAAGQ
jgi:hypothetical protein